MTDREALLKKISTYQFAVLDMQIYLDTHPGDAETLESIGVFKRKLAPLVEQYEKKYSPLTKNANEGNNWSWIKAPWPWECEEDA